MSVATIRCLCCIFLPNLLEIGLFSRPLVYLSPFLFRNRFSFFPDCALNLFKVFWVLSFLFLYLRVGFLHLLRLFRFQFPMIRLLDLSSLFWIFCFFSVLFFVMSEPVNYLPFWDCWLSYISSTCLALFQ